MSSVQTRPFGEIRRTYSGMGQAKKAVFQVIVHSSEVHDLADFLELIYLTEVKITLADDGAYKLTFSSASHRTESGVRFAARLLQAELLKVNLWF